MKLQPFCYLASTDVLSAKLWQHFNLKTYINTKENCHLSAEFTVGLDVHKGLFEPKWFSEVLHALKLNGFSNAQSSGKA